MAKEISRESLKIELAKGTVTLVEALPEKYYNTGHLPGAVQMNYSEIDAKSENLLPNKDAFIVTYCASDTCPNSTYAAEQLISMGYINVHKYVGGKKDWVESGEVLQEV